MERVTIIGAGLAGLSAARTLAAAGRPCTLVSAFPSERAQSVMAEGGINAALDLMGEADSWEQHAEDTLRGGCYLADPQAVWQLCEGAPDVVRDYLGLGVPFNVERGHMVQRYFGGQKKARTAFAKSSTGKALVTALVDAVRRFEVTGSPQVGSDESPATPGSQEPLVQRLSHHELVALHVSDGGCDGATVRDAYTGELLKLPAPIILCTGGYGGLFGDHTTGAVHNDGSVHALALAAGVKLANLEFVQYHPTTARMSGKRMLISEAARGEGGRLWVERNGEHYYFMEDRYPEFGNLSPRDVVSREEARVLADPTVGNQINLDLTGLDACVWRERLSDLREECVHYLGIDPVRTPLPVEPGIHYTMGGMWVDAQHRCSVRGLYAAGECACIYHGANRLGGNSLLGASFGGKLAAETVLADGSCSYARERAEREACGASPATAPSPADRAADAELHRILNASLGIVRDAASLELGLRELAQIDRSGLSALERARLDLGCAAISCALAREESRGAHWRSDFPETRDEFRQTTVVTLDAQGCPVVSFAPVGKETEDAS